MSDASVSREEVQRWAGIAHTCDLLSAQRLARAHLELLDLNDQDAKELRLIKADLLKIKVRVEELRRDKERLLSALTKLANEASGFVGQARVEDHGFTNCAVIKQRIDEAREAIDAAMLPDPPEAK